MVKAVPAPEETLEQQVGRIAGLIGSERFPTGERAALRRMTPVTHCLYPSIDLPWPFTEGLGARY